MSALILFSTCVSARVQEAPPSTKNFVHLAKEFLNTLYPSLSSKPVMTLQTSMDYQDSDDTLHFFSLWVGDASPDQVTGYLGGYVGQQPKDFQPGPTHPKQYILSNFRFDLEGRILEFRATGAVIGNPDAYKRVTDILASSPGWTDERAADELKRAGARYAPVEKDKFQRDLPVHLIEKYLGPLTITSVNFNILRINQGESVGWLEWVVEAKVKTPSGSSRIYKLEFEPFNGDLTAITKQ